MSEEPDDEIELEDEAEESEPRDVNVLVVDDDPVYRQLLVMALESEGYCVTGAEDGAKALELVRTAAPDLIILDLLMPVMDGLSFLRALKDEERTIPTLVHTCLEERGSAVDALVSGASDVLTKPASLDEILKRIEAVVS